jgi:hypothetical protein
VPNRPLWGANSTKHAQHRGIIPSLAVVLLLLSFSSSQPVEPTKAQGGSGAGLEYCRFFASHPERPLRALREQGFERHRLRDQSLLVHVAHERLERAT